MDKKEELFRKLDKRYEDHQATKERNREARGEAESKSVLENLNDWTSKIETKIEAEIQKKDTDNAQSILDEISDDMQKLDSYFVEYSPTLTKFDTKKVQQTILDLRSNFNELQDHLVPKKKFGFKGNKKKEYQNATKKVVSQNVDQVDKAEKSQEFGFTIKDKSGETIIIDSSNVRSGSHTVEISVFFCHPDFT